MKWLAKVRLFLKRKRFEGAPHLFWARELKEWPISAKGSAGIWYMARPMCYPGFRLIRRTRLAWGVFTGRYDAVRWSEL